MNTIILANGAFPQSEKLLKLLDTAGRVICCDGAVNSLVESGREPSVIIGDLDSVKPEVKLRYSNRLVQVTDQQTNDLTKAVNWCVGNGIKEVTILGATGKREDHAIGNISLLSDYSKKLNVKILTDYGEFVAIAETTTFASFAGQQVSIFSLNTNLKITSKGLKYPLSEYNLTSWWMGTLNESEGEVFTIIFGGAGDVIVYLLDKR
jgi:thiamine pyrophosphokinase